MLKYFTAIIFTFLAEPEPNEPNEPNIECIDAYPEPMNECGAPLCVTIKEGVAHTAACEDCGAPWVPGTPVTCGDIVCNPSGSATECRWVCRPSADW